MDEIGTGGLLLSLLGDFRLLTDRSNGDSSTVLLGNLLEVEDEIIAVWESTGGTCDIVKGC